MLARLGVVLGLLITTAASAAPPAVPEPLRPWIDWVLHDQDAAQCPFIGAPDTRQCAWPSRLTLVLDDHGGRFSQQWLVHRPSDVMLPGDAAHWPQQVTVGDKPAVVTERDGIPVVRLEPGTPTIAGTFEWDTLPELLETPGATGLVSLAIGGQVVPFPNRDAQGRLWLRARTAEADAEDRLDVVVMRLLRDDVPALLVTRIALKVAGKSRETVLATTLPPGFVPLELQSPLPARIEPDGHLRVQLRPGTWTIDVTGRHEGPLASIGLAEPDAPWASEEVWAFQAMPSIRQVTIEGVDTVDPSQTMLPQEWRMFPAYRLKPGDTIKIVETRRGDADPAPDQLALERTWWLDFEGGGYTVHDRVTGVMTSEWRLEMAPPMMLGRVTVNDQDQPITRLADGGPAGVEVRDRSVTVESDARLDGDVGRVPAVGWLHDFASVSATLNLPPGWHLFYARGVDVADPTWVSRWSLLDLFIVLVIAMAFLRLYGSGWGAVALATLGLTYHEPGSPGVVWLCLLGAEALVRVLPAGRMLGAVRMLRIAIAVVLIAIAAPYVMREMRLALYPSLETTAQVAESLPASAPARVQQPLARLAYKSAAAGGMADEMKQVIQRYEIDPNMRVQTGPGRPTWSWNRVTLRWQGPVERAQALGLMLIPPWATRLLGVLRVVLVAALLLCLLRGVRLAPGAGVAALVAVALAMAPATSRADFPNDEMLKQLRERLLEPPKCLPSCVGINRLALEAGSTLRMRLEIDAATETGVALPGSAQDWTPATVLVDDKPATGLSRTGDGKLWLAMTPGRHQVLLEGPLPPRDAVSIPLPERPHRVTATLSGWTITGLREDGLAEDNLQLMRIESGEHAGRDLEPGTLPPFVRVTRQIGLGLTWEVDTQVERLSPLGAAIVLDVPLLEGEAVTTAGIRATAGKAAVSLAPQARATSWHSVLDQRDTIRLAAPASVAWVEVWSLNAGPMWHVDVDGIPTVQPDATEARVRTWLPWPGEQVTVRIVRPTAMPGPTFTIDQSRLEVHPGLRATDTTLSFTARSSQGGRYRIGLPAASTLQSVNVNGRPQPIRQEGDAVTLPITPGTQQFELVWRTSPDGIATRFVSPAVDLGVASVNATTEITVPESRWILAVGGPRLGPAVLFWSTLVVIALVAVALARTSLAPLGGAQWFLLGIGLSQADVMAAIIVVGWFLALGWRRRRPELGPRSFDLFQIVLVPWTLAMLAILFFAIQQGLLGSPNMQIAGNGSSAFDLRWYTDRAGPVLPRAWVLSVPVIVYRFAMLAWAVWISVALVGNWLGWAWECFSAGGLWRTLRRKRAVT